MSASGAAPTPTLTYSREEVIDAVNQAGQYLLSGTVPISAGDPKLKSVQTAGMPPLPSSPSSSLSPFISQKICFASRS